jgi:Zn-dependent M28 family amino/carboxypeptidase
LERITEADLRRDLFAMAGDSMRGREGGTLDEMRVSMWVADRAREAGLEPAGDDGTYFQFFPLGRVTQSEESSVTVGATRLGFPRDFVMTARTAASFDAPVLVLADDAEPDASAAGKIVVTRLTAARAAALGDVPARRGPGPMEETAVRLQRMITQCGYAIREAGGRAAFFIVEPAFERYFLALSGAAIRGSYMRDTTPATATPGGGRGGQPAASGCGPRPATPVAGGRGGQPPTRPAIPVLIFRSNALPALPSSGDTARLQLSMDRFVYPSVNIVARVPGTDPVLRNEYVLYSAHQDHDGVRHIVDGDSIWNGADDNATVSVALLAIGRALRAEPTRRSALFVWHGSEERGLHGSYWFAGHPTVPRQSIVAVLNGDMIGRNHPDTAALLGSQPPHRNSASLAAIALAANDRVTRFVVDSSWDRPTHNEGWYFRSDHLPYACVGVPALFFSTLLHSDYHTPNDEPDRIDITKLRRMTQWMYATGAALGNADSRPTVDAGFRLERPCQIQP